MWRSCGWRFVASVLIVTVSAMVPPLAARVQTTAAVPMTGMAAPVVRAPTYGETFRIVAAANGKIWIALTSGVMTGGVTTFMTLLLTSLATSETVVDASQVRHLTARQLGASVIPHGVFEVPGFVVAGAAGFGGVPLLWALAEGDRARARASTRTSVQLAAVAGGLLVVAALIETFATPMVMTWFR